MLISAEALNEFREFIKACKAKLAGQDPTSLIDHRMWIEFSHHNGEVNYDVICEHPTVARFERFVDLILSSKCPQGIEYALFILDSFYDCFEDAIPCKSDRIWFRSADTMDRIFKRLEFDIKEWANNTLKFRNSEEEIDLTENYVERQWDRCLITLFPTYYKFPDMTKEFALELVEHLRNPLYKGVKLTQQYLQSSAADDLLRIFRYEGSSGNNPVTKRRVPPPVPITMPPPTPIAVLVTKMSPTPTDVASLYQESFASFESSATSDSSDSVTQGVSRLTASALPPTVKHQLSKSPSGETKRKKNSKKRKNRQQAQPQHRYSVA